jgi:hypothetical protein
MTSVDSERRTTCAVIIDACGGAVSAAICAGDLIWRAATQPPLARSTTPVRAAITTPVFFRDFIKLLLGCRFVLRRRHCTARNMK